MELGKHLRDIGVKHFAVASPSEGIELRRAGIESHIQIFGKIVVLHVIMLACSATTSCRPTSIANLGPAHCQLH